MAGQDELNQRLISDIDKVNRRIDDAFANIIPSQKVPGNRQGGNATDFSVAGTTNYVPSDPLMQSGVLNVTSTASGGGFALAATVTFPVAFSNKPICFLTVGGGVGVAIAELNVFSISSTQLGISYRLISGTTTQPINWLAIGPK